MPEPRRPGADDPRPGDKPRVLIVDDEVDVLEVIRALRAEAGFEAASYASATEALQKARVRPFDALVLDLYMPEMSGLLFHAKLKVFNPKLAARTLFVSGYVSKEEVRQYLTTNARFLQKPFDSQELVRIVTTLANGLE